MAIVFVGIDLAKNVFAVHGVNPAGKPELVCPSVPRAKLREMSAAGLERPGVPVRRSCSLALMRRLVLAVACVTR